jgi:hypothetical protein
LLSDSESPAGISQLRVLLSAGIFLVFQTKNKKRDLFGGNERVAKEKCYDKIGQHKTCPGDR